ncbi:hypothetical protein O1611_g5222 [Lasiodiplodia mahajangana]|uniref:Uncharacterized protein n=1 Tax=Lasiodiplodia mahajangana TaxID=1108764 RepID=A0ACC2JMC5_9PEZI|nr:hypothetical protein O1611_g5222 [Lasiodiplodia mahajangana]
MQTTNSICEIGRYLDAEANDTDPDPALEFICQICKRRRLTISALAKNFALVGKQSTGSAKLLDSLVDLYVHGFERTVVLPCGHVFGDRCIREKLAQKDLVCPSCGFRMTYVRCGHAITPAIIPLGSADSRSIRDTFPLTIPEGGPRPTQCKECRWKAIKARLRYALALGCVMCVQKARPGVPFGLEDAREHTAHYTRHMSCGLKEVLSEIMMLVQPNFITRSTEESARKAMEEADRRRADTALLNVIVLTELEDTIWQGTAMKQLSEEQMRRHAAGVRAVEWNVLGMLMDTDRKPCRRMW